jgi:hypothetical protein
VSSAPKSGPPSSIVLPLLRRIVLWSVALLAILAVLWTAFCLEERWRCKRAWEAYRTAAIARGVKLDIEDFRSPDIPDDENFAASPIIQELFMPGSGHTVRVASFDKLNLGNYQRPRVPETERVKPVDLRSWRDCFVANFAIPKSNDNSAEGVLRALETFRPVHDQLREAGKRPHSRFPVQWELGYATPLPHLGPLLKAAQVEQLAIVAHLELGDSPAAYEHVRDVLQLYYALRDEPTVTCGNIRQDIVLLLDAAVRTGLMEDRWAEPELQKLIADYGGIDWLADWHFALASQRAMGNKFFERLQSRTDADFIADTGTFEDKLIARAIVTLYPRGWLYLSQLKVNDHYDRLLTQVESIRKGTRTGLTKDPPDELAALDGAGSVQTLPYQMALYVVLGDAGIMARYLELAANLEITRTACQLARYHNRTGTFPESLQSLVPEFLTELPRDPMDNAPLRYRVTETGYDLWSIGLNGEDDGGYSSRRRNMQLNQLDWVFQH